MLSMGRWDRFIAVTGSAKQICIVVHREHIHIYIYRREESGLVAKWHLRAASKTDRDRFTPFGDTVHSPNLVQHWLVLHKTLYRYKYIYKYKYKYKTNPVLLKDRQKDRFTSFGNAAHSPNLVLHKTLYKYKYKYEYKYKYKTNTQIRPVWRYS